jgi:hypothetical protein
MPSLSDLVVLSADRQPVMIVECKNGRGTSAQSVALYRRNLLAHDLLPPIPFYLLAFSTMLFLWKGNAEPEDLPQFSAPAALLLHDYVPSVAAQNPVLNADSLELVMHSWLDDLANGIRKPKDSSEADQMLIKSGVLELIRNGTVSSRIAL